MHINGINKEGQVLYCTCIVFSPLSLLCCSHPFTAKEGTEPGKHEFQMYEVKHATKQCYVCRKKVSHAALLKNL